MQTASNELTSCTLFSTEFNRKRKKKQKQTQLKSVFYSQFSIYFHFLLILNTRHRHRIDHAMHQLIINADLFQFLRIYFYLYVVVFYIHTINLIFPFIFSFSFLTCDLVAVGKKRQQTSEERNKNELMMHFRIVCCVAYQLHNTQANMHYARYAAYSCLNCAMSDCFNWTYKTK